MHVEILPGKPAMGTSAAALIADKLNEAIEEKGEACMVMATGASQFEVVQGLAEADVDWSKVVCFHMDEYIGVDETHPASFRKYLKERFADQVSGLKAFHYVIGSAEDPQAECDRLEGLIKQYQVDVVQGGIGENGHLAFNDSPADFDTERSYLVVELDEACRSQQLGEGWFEMIDDVPRKAISISIKQVMAARCVVCSVPDERKARAVKSCLEGAVDNMHPASILQRHSDCHIFLDEPSASLLETR
ncbi:MAG: glucosamine-6-phosphate deaminase [Verrucomicrobia bacterium]|nr:glucosamine-6-phosphate deaminase [Verrucomicrobiota bacterium]